MSDVDSEEEEEEEEVEETKLSIGEYEGERNADGERHGVGKAVFPNGDVYEGSYQHGHRHGEGLYKFQNRARYRGKYLNDKKHGNGMFNYPDGSVYEGEWFEDERHGDGTYIYSNGDSYTGSWFKNKRHGKGVYTYKECGACHIGFWQDGQLHGGGEIQHTALRYQGFFKNGRPLGKGKFVFDVGCELNGEYVIQKQETFYEEEDAIENLPTKWKPSKLTMLTLWDPNADGES
uniref:Radial spoke head 1 homolog n=1 Tax=Eptatretus burgeri TaxID=7764 RepID=A0A8C4QA65_EPTBU